MCTSDENGETSSEPGADIGRGVLLIGDNN